MADTLSQIIDDLITLGENRDELEFWKTIYPDLSASEQKELMNNLENELQKLRGISKNS